MWVNIVVASVHNDMNVPGAERVKLQGRMDQSGSRGCGLGYNGMRKKRAGQPSGCDEEAAICLM